MSTDGIYTDLEARVFTFLINNLMNSYPGYSVKDSIEEFSKDTFEVPEEYSYWFWRDHILMIPEELMT